MEGKGNVQTGPKKKKKNNHNDNILDKPVHGQLHMNIFVIYLSN